MPANRISEAPESNAGDDFHVLWALKRSFELLNFKVDGLKSIVVEGIEYKDSQDLDPDGSKFLAVDVAEYYGGENFIDAHKVIISQLKHSTRQVSNDWTFYNLYEGKKSGSYEGSIIHKLATSFKTLSDKYGDVEILKKLSVKFVSNRKFNSNQYDLLLKIKSKLLDVRKLTDKIITDHFLVDKDRIIKLRNATKLNFEDFSNFLRILDLSECGVDSSYKHEVKIIEALNAIGYKRRRDSDSLYRYILRTMLPEAVDTGQNKILVNDLLYHLDTNLEMLFPVKQKFEKIQHIIKREQIDDVINLIESTNEGKPICIHGEAGIGKSTFSQLIQLHSPDNLKVIIFDCYGSGEYLNPSDQRHQHRQALPQIANEIAKEYGSAFLVNQQQDPYLLLREFNHRIYEACAILKQNNDSILTLVIDAADNSVTAENETSIKSFVRDLSKESYPENFRLIVTARTHRVDTLGLPDNYIPFDLHTFSREETEVHLLNYFPDTNADNITEFHQLTSGIPRVQSYAIDLMKIGIDEMINYLKPSGKSVADIIEDKIDDAIKRLGNTGKTTVDTFFKTLIALPRPIPIHYVSKVSKLEESLLRDLSIDIWHGLKLNENNFSFRDEDFEAFIKDKYPPDEKLKKDIAESFIMKMDEDSYAASNVGVALYNAEMYNQLIELVETEPPINAISSPIRKKEIFIDRVKFALRVCNKSNDKLTTLKVLFVAADAAKADTALKELLSENVSLSTELNYIDRLTNDYAEPISNKLLHPLNGYYEAAISTRSRANNDTVKSLLKDAEYWVHIYSQEKKDDSFTDKKVGISYTDISYGFEAQLRINGIFKAKRWLLNWKPKELYSTISNIVIRRVSMLPANDFVNQYANDFSCLPVSTQLAVIDNLQNRNSFKFDFDRIYRVVTKYISIKEKLDSTFRTALLSFCEFFADKHADEIRELLRLTLISPPNSIYISSIGKGNINDSNLSVDCYFRAAALINRLQGEESITIESITKDVYDKHTEEKQKSSNDKENYKYFTSHALRIYNLRSKTYFTNIEDDLHNEFVTICSKVEEDYSFRFTDRFRITDKLLFLALRLIDVLPHLDDKKTDLNLLIKSFLINKQNIISLPISIAEKLCYMNGFSSLLFDPLIREANNKIGERVLSSQERIEWLIRFSNILLYSDLNLSKYYFEEAVRAVNEVDLEAFDKIKCLNELTSKSSRNKEKELSHKFSEYLKFSQSALSGYDKFPMKEGIEIIAQLDISTAFKILCQWDHLSILELSEYIHVVLIVAVNVGKALPKTEEMEDYLEEHKEGTERNIQNLG